MPKISQFPSGGVAQNTDLIPIVRSGGDYTVTGAALAALANYSQAYSGTFTATAGQTVFTLPASPGSLANLFVSVDGAVMVPGVDYTWTSPVTLTFAVGLAAGQTVLYRYTSSVPVGTSLAGGTNGQLQYNNSGVLNGFTMSGDVTVVPTTGVATVNAPGTHITYTQGGTGSTSRTVTAKLQESVSVLDFGADPTGSTDSTTAFTNAQGSGYVSIYIPPGTYLLNNLRIKTGVQLIGAGYSNTILKQASASNYAVNMLSDATVGQIIAPKIAALQFVGATSATVAALNMEANGVYAILDADIDFKATSTYAPLRMNCPSAGAIYNARIRLESNISTAAIQTQGSYNIYDIFNTGCAAAVSLVDTSSDSTFVRAVTEAGHQYLGQRNTILGATVENWTGAASTSNTAIANSGYDNTFINATVTTVPNASCGYAFSQNATPGTWINSRIVGTTTTSTPNYPFSPASGSSGTIIGFSSNALYLIEQYTSGTILQNWTFCGGVSTVTAIPNYRSAHYYSRQVPTSGGSITIADNVNALLIQPASLLATLTIVMPPNPVDGEVVRVSATQYGVTALTVNANTGQYILSAPTTLAAGSGFAMIWLASQTYWFRLY